MSEIRYWNRTTGREETESVYGGGGVRFLYGNPRGKKLADVLAWRVWSQAMGAWQSSRWSARGIETFAHQYGIDLGEFEVPASGFRSFNDFFVRRFKAGKRSFAQDGRAFPAFSEARYLAWESGRAPDAFPVKGRDLSPEALLDSSEKAKPFTGGAVFLARLAPVDYHRYHYPDSGRVTDHYWVRRKLHSVNPMALSSLGEVFSQNTRRVSLLETDHFGQLAYIEVGAMGVGRIAQTHDESRPFERGEEKGTFMFGGSTVIVLTQPGRIKPDADLLERTSKRLETWVKLGEKIGSA